MKTLVVLPTYQEAGNVGTAIAGVLDAAPVDILVVDDNSPDGTADAAERAGCDTGRVTVMRPTGRSGLGSAHRAGLGWGLERGYEVLVEIDADGAHDPADIPRLLDSLDGADLAIGSRYVPGGSIPVWGQVRRIVVEAAVLVTTWGLRDRLRSFRSRVQGT